MDIKDKLRELIGKTVSIMLDLNKNSLLKESYNGIIKEIGDDYILLDTNNPKFFIKELVIRIDLVISVWILR